MYGERVEAMIQIQLSDIGKTEPGAHAIMYSDRRDATNIAMAVALSVRPDYDGAEVSVSVGHGGDGRSLPAICDGAAHRSIAARQPQRGSLN